MIKTMLAVILLLALSTIALAEKRVALVVGNSAYEYVPALGNPRNDAADVAAKLESLGFEVVTGTDLDFSAMRRTIRHFIGKLEGADIAAFFYAGHGLQVGGENYMAPVDARLSSYNDLDFEAIPVEMVVSAMERNTETNLVFLDACRDNPLATILARSMGTRSADVDQGLARIGSGIGTLISFATQPGNVALDGDGRNSPFSAALVKHLGTPNEDIMRNMIRVRREVLDNTSGRQVPWENSSLTGEVILNITAETVTVNNKVDAGTDEAARAETTYWESIKDTDDPAYFNAYLQRYPEGTFVEIAKLKLAGIARMQKLDAARRASEAEEAKAGEATKAARDAENRRTAAAANASPTVIDRSKLALFNPAIMDVNPGDKLVNGIGRMI